MMKTFSLIALITVTILIAAIAGFSQWPTGEIPPVQEVAFIPVKKTMRPFRSEQELADYFRELAKTQKRRAAPTYLYDAQPSATLNKSAVAGDKSATSKEESITNTQHAGVDEGGIVKLHGDHLVVLRRGRLFTVRIGDGALRPISSVDAFGPDIDPRSTWYDEMLVSENSIVVIGYSYERGGTEIGLFQIDDSGKLDYRSTYHLRSND